MNQNRKCLCKDFQKRIEEFCLTALEKECRAFYDVGLLNENRALRTEAETAAAEGVRLNPLINDSFKHNGSQNNIPKLLKSSIRCA